MSFTRPVVELAGRKFAVDLPDLAFATGIAGWAAWFGWDAWRASSSHENLILILPISVAAVILYLFVLPGCIRLAQDDAVPAVAVRQPLAPGVGIKVSGSMALLGAFVIAGPLIGFDIACFLYIVATMAFLGERRPLVLLLVPLVFSVAAIYCFSSLLSTPLPLFFFSEYGA